jgi:hypothetical protein
MAVSKGVSFQELDITTEYDLMKSKELRSSLYQLPISGVTNITGVT